MRRSFVIGIGIVFVVSGVAGGGGCLLTTNLDQFDKDTKAAGVADSGTPMEGSTSTDGEVVVDAGGDGSSNLDASDGAVNFRCTDVIPVPAFCTDFDIGTLDMIVSSQTTLLGGVVALDDKVFRSSSRSLKLTTPPITAGAVGNARASVSRKFGFAPTKSILVAYDVLIDSVDSSSTNSMSIGMKGYGITVFYGLSAAKFREGIPSDAGPQYTQTDRSPPTTKTWVRVSLSVAIAKDASTATLAYDGVPQSALPVAIDRYLDNQWGVDVGFNFISAPDDGREVHIDNFVIDAK